MVALVTLLGIALFGICFLFLVKLLEERWKKNILLPAYVCDRDEVIERHTRYVVKKTVWWCRFRTRTMLQVFAEKIVVGVRNLKVRIISFLEAPKTLEKGSTTNIFLQQASLHKNKINDQE